MHAQYVNINGKMVAEAEAAVPYDNRAFRYGYGLFETMLIRNGSIELQEYHVDRFFTGIVHLNLDMPALMNRTWFVEEVLRTVNKNKMSGLCRVRLQVYAGSGGLFDSENQKAGYIIECFPLEESIVQLNETGLTVGIAAGLQKSQDNLANLKSCNALIYAMAAQQARANKWNDTLICNTSGNIIESSIANVFWVKDGVIYTPPLSEGCVAGVMRRKLLHDLEANKMEVVQVALSVDTLLDADEVFLTNAIRKLKWVHSINNSIYKCQIIRQISLLTRS